MRTRTHLTIAAAFSALALAGAVVPAAAATSHPHAAATQVLTVGGLVSPPAAVGDSLSAPLASGTGATFWSTPGGTTGITCKSSTFSAKVLTNPVAPGTATETVTGQTFGNCTANVVGVTAVTSITVNNLPFTAAVSDSSGFPVTVSAGTTGPIQTTVVLATLLGPATCIYKGGPLMGNALNADNSINFSAQHFTKSSGPGTCFTDAYWSAKYAPVTDVTQGGGKVFVN